MPNIDKYELISELGTGSQSTVYLGKNPQGIEVAIKISKRIDDHAVERIQNEQTILSQIDHPNLLRILDSGFIENSSYMVMEYFNGIPFKDYMGNHAELDLKAKIRLMIKIAKTVGEIHRHGYVHRDIKPTNILINQRSEEIRLTDFGIVQLPESTLTRTFSIVGTPAYLSPEGFQNPRVTPASDIYSLGAIAYEFFLGEPLFDFKTLKKKSDLGLKTISENPKSPFKVKKNFPVNVTMVLEKMLKKNPEARYQNGHEVAKALDKVLTDGFKKTRVFFKKKWCTKTSK